MKRISKTGIAGLVMALSGSGCMGVETKTRGLAENSAGIFKDINGDNLPDLVYAVRVNDTQNHRQHYEVWWRPNINGEFGDQHFILKSDYTPKGVPVLYGHKHPSEVVEKVIPLGHRTVIDVTEVQRLQDKLNQARQEYEVIDVTEVQRLQDELNQARQEYEAVEVERSPD